jgi:hypothetical protein
MIVADYIEHLVEMQKQITKTANEHQDRYLRRRVKLPTQGDSRISEFPPGSWKTIPNAASGTYLVLAGL